MWNYELYSKLVNLTLVGQDEEGLCWVGRDEQWKAAEDLEFMMSTN